MKQIVYRDEQDVYYARHLHSWGHGYAGVQAKALRSQLYNIKYLRDKAARKEESVA
jgi:hypothetical protein